jgi:filamentous hemagglutinin
VLADIGRNLTITSEQDTDRYDSSQKNISAGGSFSFGTMTGSGGIGYSRDKMDSDFASVREQSGIFAGSGGFDVTVGGHTQLDGGVMASAATADKNRLDTGTLGWRDIQNTAEYNVEHQSAGISTGGSIAGQFAGNMANGMLSGADSSGSAEGTSRAAVENGTVIVRDKANQAQDTAALSRDTENANGSIDAIFDKEKEQRRLDEAQLISDIGSQVSDIARTQGELSGESQSGTGSDIQRAIQAATAAAQGLAGGDMTAALAGAAAPYVAEIIGHRSGLDDGMEKAAAHAVANAVLAAVQGKDALAGAAGAAAGELTGTLALEMYGKDVAALSESEKQTISTLATLAGGIAGGLTGDSTASAVAGAQTGKTTVENNSISGLIPPRVQQDASLAFDPSQQGKSAEEIRDAIDASHMGPSWGDEGKISPTGQVSGDFSIGTGYTLSGSIDDKHLSVNGGSIYGLGAHAGASIGLTFGPYFPGVFGSTERDYSLNVGAGLVSFGATGNKDGIGFSFGIGPSWGISGTEFRGIDVNGSSTEEIYRHDFK